MPARGRGENGRIPGAAKRRRPPTTTEGLMSHRSFHLPARLAALAAASAACVGVAAAPAGAAQQDGLVNVDLTGNTIQLPIGVAANVCDVTVAALSTNTFGGSSVCTAASRPTAGSSNAGGGGGGVQRGLVNVSVTDNTIQVPIGIAANVCDVTVALLSSGTFTGNDRCSAVSRPVATA